MSFGWRRRIRSSPNRIVGPMTREARFAIAAAVVALTLAFVTMFPLRANANLLPWGMINLAFSYAMFLVAATISHFVLRGLRLTSGWPYFAVMFCVVFVIYFGWSLLSLRGYAELYDSRTQIVVNGAITRSGLILELTNACKAAGLLALLFFLFWWIAIRPLGYRKADADH
jgi:hypothetical protein